MIYIDPDVAGSCIWQQILYYRSSSTSGKAFLSVPILLKIIKYSRERIIDSPLFSGFMFDQ